MKIAPKELLLYAQRGLIPLPDEDEAAFLARTKKLDHFFSYPPPTIDHFLTDGDWEGARNITRSLFGFSPDWIVAYFGNDNLPFYQGGATWLLEEKGAQIPLIQLKSKFESGSLYKIYRKDEVVAHEAVHAVRLGYECPKFEEIFAYMTAPSFLRKWLGPIFQKPWESALFVFFLFLPLAAQIALFFIEPFPGLWTLFILPWLYLLLLGARLGYLHLCLKRCLKKLEQLFPSSQPLSIAFRLTDEEILLFAKSSLNETQRYIKEQKSLRWKSLTMI